MINFSFLSSPSISISLTEPSVLVEDDQQPARWERSPRSPDTSDIQTKGARKKKKKKRERGKRKRKRRAAGAGIAVGTVVLRNVRCVYGTWAWASTQTRLSFSSSASAPARGLVGTTTWHCTLCWPMVVCPSARQEGKCTPLLPAHGL